MPYCVDVTKYLPNADHNQNPKETVVHAQEDTLWRVYAIILNDMQLFWTSFWGLRINFP